MRVDLVAVVQDSLCCSRLLRVLSPDRKGQLNSPVFRFFSSLISLLSLSIQAGTHLGSPRHSFPTSSPPGREAFFFQNTFEVLCTSQAPSTSTPTKWINVPSHMMGDEVRELLRGERPVEGGRERDGAWLGVGRGVLKG